MDIESEIVEIEIREKELMRQLKSGIKEEAKRQNKKACTLCWEVLDRSEFGNNKSKPDGLMTRCRKCHNGSVNSSRKVSRALKNRSKEYPIKAIESMKKRCNECVVNVRLHSCSHWVYDDFVVCGVCGLLSERDGRK